MKGTPIPASIAGLGWALLGLTMLPIPIGMIHEIYKAVKYNKVIREKDTPYYMSLMKYVNSPSNKWHPAKAENRVGRYAILTEDDKKRSIILDEVKF